MSHKRPVPCGCAGCELPFAYIQNGVLVIESRHHGEQHVNVLRLEELIRLLQAAQIEVFGTAHGERPQAGNERSAIA